MSGRTAPAVDLGRAGLIAVTLLIFAAACTTSSGDEAASPSTETTAPGAVTVDQPALERLLDAHVEASGAPGALLGVRVPGQADIVLASGIDGGADGGATTPMRADGTFPIASLTKTFLTAVVLQLVDEGALSLDDTIDGWLPDYPHARDITLRHLLNHTSGVSSLLNPDSGDVSVVEEDPDRSWSLEEVIARNARREPFGAPPDQFHYSNANSWLLAYVVEHVTGKPVHEVLRDRIIRPLDLRETQLVDVPDPPSQHGWLLNPDDPAAPPVDTSGLASAAASTILGVAGTGSSSATDLLDWGEALYGGEFLGEARTSEMLALDQDRLVHLPDGTTESIGLRYGLGAQGWCPCDTDRAPPQPVLVGHDGQLITPGTAVGLVHHLDTGITVVVRANAGTATALDHQDTLLRAIADELDLRPG